MKIEWTDAACNAAVKAFFSAEGVGCRTWRAALNAATAEQFRPETPEEKCRRYEAAMADVARKLEYGDMGVHTARIALQEALAGPNGGKERGT